MNRWRGAGLALAVIASVGYALAVHYSNSHREYGALGAVLALLPLLLVAWLGRRSWRLLWWLAVAAGAALIVVGWPLLERNYPLLYLLQQLAVYTALAVSFGMTLRDGQVPLCTRIAAQLHSPLPAAVAEYTRGVTLAWTLLFAVLALLLVLTYLLLPLPFWSVCANFIAPLLMGAMFGIEALARRWALPRQQRAGMLAAIRAYLKDGAHSARGV